MAGRTHSAIPQNKKPHNGSVLEATRKLQNSARQFQAGVAARKVRDLFHVWKVSRYAFPTHLQHLQINPNNAAFVHVAPEACPRLVYEICLCLVLLCMASVALSDFML